MVSQPNSVFIFKFYRVLEKLVRHNVVAMRQRFDYRVIYSNTIVIKVPKLINI